MEHSGYYAEFNGKELKLRRGEFLILSLLARKPLRYFSSQEIWDHLWSGKRPFNQESLKVIVYNLRKQLEPFEVKIETLVNVGYRLVPASREVA